MFKSIFSGGSDFLSGLGGLLGFLPGGGIISSVIGGASGGGLGGMPSGGGPQGMPNYQMPNSNSSGFNGTVIVNSEVEKTKSVKFYQNTLPNYERRQSVKSL